MSYLQNLGILKEYQDLCLEIHEYTDKLSGGAERTAKLAIKCYVRARDGDEQTLTLQNLTLFFDLSGLPRTPQKDALQGRLDDLQRTIAMGQAQQNETTHEEVIQ